MCSYSNVHTEDDNLMDSLLAWRFPCCDKSKVEEFVCGGGHIQQYSGATPGSKLRNYSWWGSGDHVRSGNQTCLTKCRASALSTVLFLQSLARFSNSCIFNIILKGAAFCLFLKELPCKSHWLRRWSIWDEAILPEHLPAPLSSPHYLKWLA